MTRSNISPWWLAMLVPCALANPLSVATAPFNAAAAFASWRKGSLGTALAATGLMCAGLTAALLAALTAPLRAGGPPIGAAPLLNAFWRASLFLLDRGLFEAVVGSPARQAVLDTLPGAGPGLAPVALYAAAAAAALAMGFAARQGRREVIAFAATLAGTALVYSFIILITLGPLRGVGGEDTGILTTFGRYWFVQKIVVLAAAGTVLLEAPPFPARLESYAVSLAVGAFLLAFAANADTGSRYGLSGKADPRRAERERRSAAQHAFLDAVRVAARRGTVACIVEPGDPSTPLLRLVLPQGAVSRVDAIPVCSAP